MAGLAGDCGSYGVSSGQDSEADERSRSEVMVECHHMKRAIKNLTGTALLLGSTLRPLFERWYPGLVADTADEPLRAAA
jgi:hypothetical protein